MGLSCRLVLSGTVGEFNSFGFLIVACATVAVGCWKHWRWMVGLGALPILFSALVAVGLASMYNTTFQTNEAGFLIPIALLVFVLEVASLFQPRKRRTPNLPTIR